MDIKDVKKVEVRGTSLAYIERGSGEPVVFVHGALGDLRAWFEQIEALSGDYRVISYSRRGHFPNDPDASYTRAAHAADLLEFLKTLKLEKPHLIGHSYGASIALLAALEAPARVGSLILGEPSPFAELLDEAGLSLLPLQKAGFDKAARLAENGDREAAVREFLHTVMGIDVWNLLPRERRAAVLDNAATLLPMLRTYYDPALKAEALKDLKVPTMFVLGEISPVISRLSSRTIDRRLPNSKIAVLKCASHGLQLENPEGFAQLVRDFLMVNRKTGRLSKSFRFYETKF